MDRATRPGTNALLDALSDADRHALSPYLEPVELERGRTLTEPGVPPSRAVFPHDVTVIGLIATSQGRMVETAAIGREGVLGTTFAGAGLPQTMHAVVQIGGPALAVAIAHLQRARVAAPGLNAVLTGYTETLLGHALLTIACTALHPIEQRTLRWLLALHDRLGGSVPVTQDHIAMMIGVQRTYLTRILSALRDRGIIEIGRARITITDEAAAEAAVCDCRAALRGTGGRLGRAN